MVFGLARNGSALAYPYTDLAAQGVVNDRVNGDDIVIFYDDPARLAIGFSRRLGGRLLHFRASESIDDRSPLFEDVETRSTWTILGGAVAGELDGSQLVGVATYSAYWFGWSSFWLGSDIWDGQSLTPPDTAVAGEWMAVSSSASPPTALTGSAGPVSGSAATSGMASP